MNKMMNEFEANKVAYYENLLKDERIKKAMKTAEASLNIEGLFVTPEGNELILSRIHGDIGEEEFLQRALSLTTRKPGQDYNDFVKTTNELPGVVEYLQSFPVIIGDLVLAHRLQKGWTQQKLAQEAGTTQEQISMIEDGDGGITTGTLGKVLQALGLTEISAR